MATMRVPFIPCYTFRAVGKGHDKGRNAVPGAVTEALRLAPAVGDPDLPLFDITGVLDGIFVLLHQVRIAGLSDGGDADFFHGNPPQ